MGEAPSYLGWLSSADPTSRAGSLHHRPAWVYLDFSGTRGRYGFPNRAQCPDSIHFKPRASRRAQILSEDLQPGTWRGEGVQNLPLRCSNPGRDMHVILK